MVRTPKKIWALRVVQEKNRSAFFSCGKNRSEIKLSEWLHNRFDFDQIKIKAHTNSHIDWKNSMFAVIEFDGRDARICFTIQSTLCIACHLNVTLIHLSCALLGTQSVLCVCRFCFVFIYISHFYWPISVNSNRLCHMCFGGLFVLFSFLIAMKKKEIQIKFFSSSRALVSFFFKSSPQRLGVLM